MEAYALLESAPDAMLIADEDGRIVFLNSRTETLFAYRGDELVGRPVEVLVPERLRNQHSGHRNRYAASPQARPMGAGLDLRARRSDGTEFPVDISISPLTAGERGQVICTIRGISERKHIEDSLRTSEARYRSLVQGATYGIYHTTVEGRLVHVNPAFVRMLGYDTEGEVMEISARDLYVDAAEREQIISRYRASDIISDVEVRWKRRDGTPITVKLSGRILRDAEKNVGFEMIVEDVTERRRLEERLRIAEKLEAVGRLTAGVAHHFNNLLATAIGRLDVIRAVIGPNPTLNEDLNAALDALRKATLLIRRMQDIGQQTEAAPVPLSLNDVLKELLPLLMREATARVKVVLQLAEMLPPVLMDRSHFEGSW